MKGYIEIEKHQALEADSKATFGALTEQLEVLKFQLEQLKRMVFGAKSKRYIPDSPDEQLSLFDTGAKPPGEEEMINVPAHDRKKVSPSNTPFGWCYRSISNEKSRSLNHRVLI